MSAASLTVADASFLARHSASVEAAMDCKTGPYDWRIHKIQKAAGQSARRLTDLLTRLVGTGETT